jgi:L-malate glycosyltransferase
MNILILTHSYPDKYNSWRGSFVREQAKALSLTHNIIVVFFRIDYEHFAPFAKYSSSKVVTGNLTEYTLTVKKSFPVFNQLNYLIEAYRFISNEILDYFAPDVIHSHKSYPGGFLGTILQKRKKIPNIITEHSSIKTYFRSWLHKECVKYSLRNAASVIAVSNSLKEEISVLCPRHVKVIHNIVDVNKFYVKKPKREQFLNIGFLGGLGNNNKGLDLLIKSVSLLENKKYMLHIGGNGVLKDSYIEMAKDYGIESKCKFYGEITHNKIPEFYSGLDLFVLPSRYETFGIVLIEAMACGIPVIATRCGGPQEIITEMTGILIDKENIDELAFAIKRMSENLESYNSSVIRNYVEEYFGKQTFIEQISSHYNEVLTNNTHE